ncbi:hypothetical protein [Burkholderia pseudomallei]|uniref:hypothetical protein n=1 Tax=Burkholderia pseudomallei TaxID=28450 RepID=UPI0005384A3C|nr:hypothetical protein [Burkholderia pseudomallei]AJX22007.1 putative lipoprotein [Burkholderia pseudomallei MSHR491]KGW83035.1 putative lipoprotein [Burkholderia pseudomallei MSHR449]KGX74295.1 putative lipoprotein [Burkholderia pseudomallei MSHR435]
MPKINKLLPLATFVSLSACTAGYQATDRNIAPKVTPVGKGFTVSSTKTPGPDMATMKGYWRIRGTLDSVVDGTLTFDASSWQEDLFSAFARYGIWKRNTDYILSVKVENLGVPGPPAYDLLAIDGKGKTVDVKSANVDFYLTSASTQPTPVAICIYGIQQDSTQSGIANAVAQLTKVAAPLFGGAAWLTPAVQTQVDGASRAIDKAISDALTQTNASPPVCPHFSPLASPDGTPADGKMSVIFKSEGATIKLFTLFNEYLETLLSSSHRYASVPANATDILAAPLQDEKTTPGSILLGDSTVALLNNSPTVDTIQVFCQKIDSVLNDKLRLSDADRAAVAWAYLEGTVWSSPKGRPAPGEPDACLSLLSPLHDTMSQLEASYLLSPRTADIDSATLNKVKAPLLNHGIPVALGAGLVGVDTNTRKSNWLAVLSDSVTLTAVGRAVGVGPDAIPAGYSRDSMPKEQAAEFLSQLALQWVAAGNCEPPATTTASALYIGVRPACVRIVESPGAQPIPMGMTIKIDSASNPTVSRIWFFDDSAQLGSSS